MIPERFRQLGLSVGDIADQIGRQNVKLPVVTLKRQTKTSWFASMKAYHTRRTGK